MTKGWRSCKTVHPACDLFPLISSDDLRALADDIQANGLKFPVETRSTEKGLYVIDGRNRLDALELLGIQLIDDKGEWKHPNYIRYSGKRTDAEIAAEVITYNLRRRDLIPSQRAMIAAKLETMNHGGNRRSDQDATVHLETRTEIAKAINVSPRLVASAKKVMHEAPEYVGVIESGQATVSEVLKKKSKQRREKIPTMKDMGKAIGNTKRAIIRLKNAVVYDDEKNDNGKCASQLLSELIQWLQKQMKGLTERRKGEPN